MMHLRSLVLSLLFLPGGARRSIRSNDSHRDAQQRNNTLAIGLELSAGAREALIPGTGVFRRAGLQASTLREGSKQVFLRAGHFEPRRTAPWFGFVPRRAKAALQAAAGAEEDHLPSREYENLSGRRFPPLPIRRSTARARLVAMMVEVDCDVVIVGGGPAGLTCALYTARAKHKTVVVDKNPDVGALAITSTIANYPGVDPTISGAGLLDKMRDTAIDYGTDYRREQVFGVDVDGECKTVYTPEGTYKGKAIVIATGAMGRTVVSRGREVSWDGR